MTNKQNKKVVVTGCFDLFHSGHVKFLEEASKFGDLYVSLGNDANIRELKGPDHPMFGEEERLYIVQSIRYVKHAWVASGRGLLDAEVEIRRVRPDFFVVNEDGDYPIKRKFCKEHDVEYVVLNREPRPNLPRRESMKLKGETMMIPQDAKERIDRYVKQGVPPGGFLHAVLSNDLFEAVTRTDENNLSNICDISRYVHESTPNVCHGSLAKVQRWLKLHEKYGHDVDRIPKENL